MAAIPNSDRGDASAAHEEEAARALKRLAIDVVAPVAIVPAAGGAHSSVDYESAASHSSGHLRPDQDQDQDQDQDRDRDEGNGRHMRTNPREGKARSNSLRQRALRPPPLQGAGAGSHSGGKGTLSPGAKAGVGASRRGKGKQASKGLLSSREYADAGAILSSDDEHIGGQARAGFVDLVSGGAEPGSDGVVTRRYLALRVRSRSTSATSRGAQLVTQADTDEFGLGSRIGSSAGSEALSAGMVAREGLFASDPAGFQEGMNEDHGHTVAATAGIAPGWMTSEAGAADVNIGRIIQVLWPDPAITGDSESKSISDPLDEQSDAEDDALPESEASDSSVSEASDSGYSTGSSLASSVISHTSGLGLGARISGKLGRAPASPNAADTSPFHRRKRRLPPPLQVPGATKQGVSDNRQETQLLSDPRRTHS